MEENIKIDKSKRSFIILTRRCINNCLFCTEKSKAHWPEPTTKEVKEILMRDCKLFPCVDFSGGEPTLRKDICELIEYAKKLGYYVRLFTNGRLFSNSEFTKRVAMAGLDAVLIPLHGHTAEIHDRVTQKSGSFKQTILGIKNLASYNIEIQLKTISNKINYKILPNVASFVVSLPYVCSFGMDMLVISKIALENKETILTKLSNMVPYIERAVDISINAGKKTSIWSMPLCLVKQNYWKYIPNNRVIKEIHIGLDNKNNISTMGYQGQVLAPICENCLLKERCSGTWPPYFRIYGDGELKPIIGPPHSCF